MLNTSSSNSRHELMWAGVLWTVAPSLVLFLLVYAAVGTVLTTTVFGKRLMQLQFLQLQKEGDLRFDLVRTRENSGDPLAAPKVVQGVTGMCTTSHIHYTIRVFIYICAYTCKAVAILPICGVCPVHPAQVPATHRAAAHS